jgi:hypothetical protein
MALLCVLSGHRFTEFSDGFKRKCDRCKREEWLMPRPYPKIGEAKYFWEHMDFERRFELSLREKAWLFFHPPEAALSRTPQAAGESSREAKPNTTPPNTREEGP